MVATIILDLILFYIVGWVVHFIMGSDGGPLHYCFIGGAGAGLGALLEWVANRSAGPSGESCYFGFSALRLWSG